MNYDVAMLLKEKHVLNILYIKSKITKKVAQLNVEIVVDKEPIPFAKRNENTKPFKNGKWGNAFDCCWMHFTGTVPSEHKDKKLALHIGIKGEGQLVDSEGNAIQGITSVMSMPDVFSSTTGKTLIDIEQLNLKDDNIDIWIEGGYNGVNGIEVGYGKLNHSDIVIIDEDIKKYYYDYIVTMFAIANFKKDKNVQKAKEVNALLSSSFKTFKKVGAKAASEILSSYLGKPSEVDFELNAVGHSHLDLAWLWPIRETKRKAVRTFTNALTNIERYPDYIYGASQPQQFEWVKEMQPSVYEKIKKAVSDGRIELQGGMWVECDTNISGGEALIRQILLGKKFFNEEFGEEMRICWLPDVFGYSAALPQILKKTGIDYFMTIKLSWNEHNKFPLSTFNWTGLDDSEVIVHMPPEGTYNSNCYPTGNKKAHDDYSEKNNINEALLVYGAGDGGGGPGEGHLEVLTRQKSVDGLAKVKFSKAIDFFDRLKEKKDSLQNYKGELYLEKHQGTYTTQSNNKKYNRKLENALHDLEFIASSITKKGYKYPKDEITKIWKEVLLYQFHDIIPGSSIKRVYDESVVRYKELLEQVLAYRDEALSFIADGEKNTVINTTAFNREEYIKSNNAWYLAKVDAYSSNTVEKLDGSANLTASENDIENNLFKVTFSKNGEIISLIDKTTGKETVGKYLNRLAVYQDKKLHYNAWDIDINYTKKKPSTFKLIKHENIIDKYRVLRRNTYRYNNSTIIQDVVLTEGRPYVDFETHVSWFETHKMLRAEFVPSTFSDKVLCDIQFGNLLRNTGTTNKLDWAQFEICAHKYVDVSDNGYGVAMLSESKYGWRVKDGLISLNLLRSPVYPDPNADRGEHHFKYAFMPHAGDAYESEVIKQAYLYNMPLVATRNNVVISSPMSFDASNIIIETIKPSENSKGIIVRAYECQGKETTTVMTSSFTKISETDMLENVIAKTTEEIIFKPYEIKTFFLSK